MDFKQMIHNLEVPKHAVDVVLDTDAGNETDDLYAIAYLLRSSDKLHTKAIYAAPYFNSRSISPEDGMERSYEEVLKLLSMLRQRVEVFKGSGGYLPDENTFVESPAARDLVRRAAEYSPEHPLYVVAIGAVTNVASALLMDPGIAENIVIVWLGGNALHYMDNREFNMKQDIAAARVVMGSKAPFVHIPAYGVITEFRISGPELETWLCGKGELADYLAGRTLSLMEGIFPNRPWTHVVCDVVAVAWLLNEDDCFMSSRVISTQLPSYDHLYEEEAIEKQMRYVYFVKRDALMQDMIQKLACE